MWLLPSTWPRHAQSPWPCLGFHLLLSLVGIQSCRKMALEWERALQSCLNIAQGKRNAGARPGCSKNSPEPAAHSSASFGTARSQASGQAQQARAVPEPGSVPDARLAGTECTVLPKPPPAGAWDTSAPGDPEIRVRRGCENTRNVLGLCLFLIPCPSSLRDQCCP